MQNPPCLQIPRRAWLKVVFRGASMCNPNLMGYRQLLLPLGRALNAVRPGGGRQEEAAQLGDELAALQLLYLLINSRTWAHRRVDALRLDLEGSTRRFVSVDITVPEAYAITAASRNRIIVPLGMMRKGAIQRLDAKQDSTGLAVLGKRENSALAFKLLQAAVKGFPRKSSATAEDEARVFQSIVAAKPGSAHAVHEAYKAWKERSLDTDSLTARDKRRLIVLDVFASRLVGHYIFLVEIDSKYVGTRTTLKYSLDQEIKYSLDQEKPSSDIKEVPSWGTQIRFHFKLPDFGFAESQHMELELPSGLCIKQFLFLAFDHKQVLRQADRRTLPPGRRVAHAFLNPERSDFEGEVWAHTMPSKEGLYRFAKWAAIISSILVVATIIARCFDREVLRPEAIIPSPAASIILIAPALMLSWMSRKPEHPLVTVLLAPLRRIVLACAAVLVMMAVLAAVPVAPLVWHVIWICIYIGTGLMVVYAWSVFRGYKTKPRYSITMKPT